MPELPEVEVIRQGLSRTLPGRRIAAVACGPVCLRQQTAPADLAAAITGRTIASLSRRGKYLLVHLDDGSTLLVHLGMTGRLLVFPAPAPELLHAHLILHLSGGYDLVYQDPRRFGQVLAYPPGVTPPALAHVGLEPFDRRLTAAGLLDQTRGRRRPVKNYLLDGRQIAGIGNIYACESLFAARLHPATPVGQLTREQWRILLRAVRRILKAAIRQGGTSISDYVDSTGQTGLFHLELQVYGRTGEPCPVCRTPIARLVQAGRSSFFCPACQPAPAIEGPA